MRKTQIWNDNYIELQFGSKTILFLGNLAQVPVVTRFKANFDVVRQQFFNSPWNKNYLIKVKRVFDIWNLIKRLQNISNPSFWWIYF